MAKQNVEDKLMSARIRLLLQHPFFGQLMMSLKLREMPEAFANAMRASGMKPTAGTDGKEIIYHKEFIAGLTREQCQFLLAHEIGHVFLLHQTRRQGRDPEIWNKAGDYVINLMLRDAGFSVLASALIDNKYKDWSTEQVYEHLTKNPAEQPGSGGKDGEGLSSWNIGAVQDAGSLGSEGSTPMTKAEIQGMEAEIKGKVQNAMATAKKAGRMPGSVERAIQEILEPKANWQDILQRFVSARAFADYNFGMCHTRQLRQYGIINPVLDSPELGDVNVIVDVSGSIQDDELAQFAGELSDVVGNFPGTTINVVYCDTEVQKVDTFEDSADLKLVAVGGGGTVLKPAFDYVANNFTESSCIILFSDSYLCDWKEIELPAVPALMACSTKRVDAETPDWIEVIDIS